MAPIDPEPVGFEMKSNPLKLPERPRVDIPLPETHLAGPLGSFDKGEPLYIVVDEEGRHLSYHRTEQGADAFLSTAIEI